MVKISADKFAAYSFFLLRLYLYLCIIMHKMSIPAAYIIVFFSLLICSPSFSQQKEYIEKNGLHSDSKPKEMAKEIGRQQKHQERDYLKQLRKSKRQIARRNRKKQKGKYFE